MGIVTTKSSYILGIDLGTSTTTVSVYTKGKSRVFSIEGKDSMASAVSFLSKDSKIVGDQAKSRAILDPANTITSIKSHMGEDGYTVNVYGEDYTPAQISAEILIKAVESAMNQEDFETQGQLKYAVICVPANFTENSKQATREAAEIAGLEVLYLLEEPVAAAIMYGFNSNKDQNILVYDLGGGTFDVCILKANTKENGEANYDVLSKEGVNNLGGDDFDLRLMSLINDAFKQENGMDLLDSNKDQGISKKKMKEAQQKLKEVAEKTKIELSESEDSEVLVPNIVQNEEGQSLSIDTTITRAQFNESIMDLIDKSEEAVNRALENGNLTVDDIDKIILVGGSTLVPIVKDRIKEVFGVEPYSNFNPKTIVSEGAAIFGATLSAPSDAEPNNEDKPDGEIKIQQIVTHNLGIMISGMRFSKLISKGTEIPEEGSIFEEKEYTTQSDDQTELSILIYQSAEDIETINEKDDSGEERAVCIGEFKLKNIPKSPKGQETIKVKFEINQENTVKVTATSIGSGSTNEITLEIDKK